MLYEESINEPLCFNSDVKGLLIFHLLPTLLNAFLTMEGMMKTFSCTQCFPDGLRLMPNSEAINLSCTLEMI